MPNIVGGIFNISETWNATGYSQGAFSKATGYDAGYTPAHGDNSYSGAINFNASWSNSIYGSSTTVTPLSQKTNFIIKY